MGVSMVRLPAGGMLFALVLTVTWCKAAGADGGSMCVSTTTGGYRITVFTSPTPLRCGFADVSVLVQESLTNEPITQVQATVRASNATGRVLEHEATARAATNKLFRSAHMELPEKGRWRLHVDVYGPHGPAEADCEVEVGEALPRWLEIWPWIGWPGLVILLFGIHQWRKSSMPAARQEWTNVPTRAQ